MKSIPDCPIFKSLKDELSPIDRILKSRNWYLIGNKNKIEGVSSITPIVVVKFSELVSDASQTRLMSIRQMDCKIGDTSTVWRNFDVSEWKCFNQCALHLDKTGPWWSIDSARSIWDIISRLEWVEQFYPDIVE